MKTKEIKNWKEEIDKRWHLWNQVDNTFTTCGEEIKDFITQLLSQYKQEMMEEIEKLITEEMLICHKENQPTSRLTSLITKLKQIKQKLIN